MGSVKRRMVTRASMAVLMLAIVAGFYWKLTLTRQFEWVWEPDLAHGARVQAVCEAAERAAAERRWVRVEEVRG